MFSLYVQLGTVALVFLSGIICNPMINNNIKDKPPPQFLPLQLDSIQKMPDFVLFDPREETPEFKQAPIPDDITNFLKMMDTAGIASPTRSSIVGDILRGFPPMQEAIKQEEKPTSTPVLQKTTNTMKNKQKQEKTVSEQAPVQNFGKLEPKQEKQPAPVKKEDGKTLSLPAAAEAAAVPQRSESKQEVKVKQQGTQTEKVSVSGSEVDSKQKELTKENESHTHTKPTWKDEHIITIPIPAPRKVTQKDTHPILGGFPREMEPSTRDESPKTGTRIITVPLTNPANLVNILKNLRPTIQDPQVYQAPEIAVREGFESNLRESQKSETPSLVTDSDSESGEPRSESDESKQEKPEKEKMVAIELPGPGGVTMTIRKLGEPKKEKEETPIQKEVPQNKFESILSLPEPSGFADALNNLRARLEEPSEDEDNQLPGSPAEREERYSPLPVSDEMAKMMSAFDSIIEDLKQTTGFPSRNGPPPNKKRIIDLPSPVIESANVALPLLQTLNPRFDEPRRQIAHQSENRGTPFSMPEFAAGFLGPELGLDRPNRETDDGMGFVKELLSEFNEPKPTMKKKEVFEVMYVKHLTFKLQIHMKVWHMFFVHVYPNPEAANNCTVVLSSVTKFYKRLCIDVQVVEKFRVLHRVAKMMKHNDENLKSFLARDTFKPSLTGIRKLMNMQDTREKPNDIVASLWEDAMSHFDDQLADVDNFFNGVLTNDEYAGSVLDFISDTTEITTYRKYLSRVASEFGTKFLHVDTEVTQIRTRRKIFRKPNPNIRASMNDKIMKLYQKAFGQFLNFAE